MRQETHRDNGNKTMVITTYHRSLSPNNSVRSRTSSITHYSSSPSQMKWFDDVSRHSSLHSYDRKNLAIDEIPLSSTPRMINNMNFEPGSLPRIKQLPREDEEQQLDDNSQQTGVNESRSSVEKIRKIFMFFEPKGCLKERDDYSLYLFPPDNRYFFDDFITWTWNKFESLITILSLKISRVMPKIYRA